MLTKEQKLLLADKVREVAYECAEGVPLRLGVYLTFLIDDDGHVRGPCCFLGHAAMRAHMTYLSPADLPVEDRWMVTDANDYARNATDRRRRVVFPALNLADVLEESARK